MKIWACHKVYLGTDVRTEIIQENSELYLKQKMSFHFPQLPFPFFWLMEKHSDDNNILGVSKQFHVMILSPQLHRTTLLAVLYSNCYMRENKSCTRFKLLLLWASVTIAKLTSYQIYLYTSHASNYVWTEFNHVFYNVNWSRLFINWCNNINAPLGIVHYNYSFSLWAF